MSQLAEAALWVAVLLAVWCTVASVAGTRPGREALAASGARALPVMAVLTACALAVLLRAFAARDFSHRLVAEMTTLNLPSSYAVAASWNTPSGLALVGALAVACFGTIAATRLRAHAASAAASAHAVLGVLLVGILLVAVTALPFERLPWLPAEGQGLSLRLQAPLTVMAPLVVACGVALAAVGQALALAALVRHRDYSAWRRDVRGSFAGAWLAFTITACLALWEALRMHEDPARWMWEPVRDGTLFPWLAITALLHTLRLDGQIEDDASRPAPATMLLAALAWGTSLIALWRFREGLFAGVPGMVLLMTSVSPFVWTMFVLRSSEQPRGAGGSSRARQTGRAESGLSGRLGAHVAHAGAIAIGVALLGTLWHREIRVVVEPGVPLEVRDPLGRAWTFVHQGVSRYADGVSDVTAIAIEAARGGAVRGLVTSTRREPLDSRGESLDGAGATIGRLGGVESDVRIGLERVRPGDSAEILVRFEPLAWWIWIGAFALIAGGVLILWPATRSGVGLSPPIATTHAPHADATAERLT